MFSLSKIKNKKSFFLPILLLSAFSMQCYGMEKTVEEAIKHFGSKDDPIHIVASNGKTPQQEDSIYYKTAWTLFPLVAMAALNCLQKKWDEDPELNNLNKEEKKIELELKKHPDYPAITLLHQKNAAEDKANQNKQVLLNVELQKAQLLEHHQEKSSYFLQCTENGSSERERNYCRDMYERHNNLIKSLFPAQ